MSAFNDYLDKCLAECPEGAEEILLGEIAKRLFQKHGPQERLEVRDRNGIVGYFLPSFAEIFEMELPPDLREKLLREVAPNEQRIPAQEYLVLAEKEYKSRCQELTAQAARNGQPL